MSMLYEGRAPHRCGRPHGAAPGAIWQCECGRCWRAQGKVDGVAWRRAPRWLAHMWARIAATSTRQETPTEGDDHA